MRISRSSRETGFSQADDEPDQIEPPPATGVNRSGRQPGDLDDCCRPRVGFDDALAVGVGHVDRVPRDDDTVRAKTQRTARDNSEAARVDLDQPAAVVGDPEGALAEGDALRT